ncbi:RNA-binding domain-containing protein [Neoconidiobolus thromboides FSU 785]|nr:RNA-binding domain-containing protein [Neoconidiobolus thromboides FSU 785]
MVASNKKTTPEKRVVPKRGAAQKAAAPVEATPKSKTAHKKATAKAESAEKEVKEAKAQDKKSEVALKSKPAPKKNNAKVEPAKKEVKETKVQEEKSKAEPKKEVVEKKPANKKVAAEPVSKKKGNNKVATETKSEEETQAKKPAPKAKAGTKRSAQKEAKDSLPGDSSDEEEEEDDVQVEELAQELDSDEEEVETEDIKSTKTKAQEADHFSKQIGKEMKNKLNLINSQKDNNNEYGVVYLGHIPKGFEEKEIKGYFSQFGTITNLRMSRNKKTGKSRHYAFIEYKFREVAEVVVETMDNYLLSGRLLRCKLVPKEKVHPSLFWGAGQPIKLSGNVGRQRNLLKKPKTEVQVHRRSDRLILKEKQKRKVLKAMGIDYDFKGVGKTTRGNKAEKAAKKEVAPAVEAEKEAVSVKKAPVVAKKAGAKKNGTKKAVAAKKKPLPKSKV